MAPLGALRTSQVFQVVGVDSHSFADQGAGLGFSSLQERQARRKAEEAVGMATRAARTSCEFMEQRQRMLEAVTDARVKAAGQGTQPSKGDTRGAITHIVLFKKVVSLADCMLSSLFPIALAVPFVSKHFFKCFFTKSY